MNKLDDLIEYLSRQASDRRFLLGLAGPPGSGKSTIAEKLVEATANLSTSPLTGEVGRRRRPGEGERPNTMQQIEARGDRVAPSPGPAAGGTDLSRKGRGRFASLLPMDGFHLANAELDRLNLRRVKGSPPTYHVESFIALLGILRGESQTILAPKYSRELHEPVADAIAISPDTKLVIVEGNYLLLDTPPWDRVKGLLDEVWYVDVPEEVCMDRVRQRHIRGGSPPELAARKIETNDRPNYRTIAATKQRADRVIVM